MSTHRLAPGVRVLILEGPHAGDFVEAEKIRQHVRLLEPMPLVDLLHRDPDIYTYVYRRFAARISDQHVDEVWVVGGYVPEDWSPAWVPRLALVGLHAMALLSS